MYNTYALYNISSELNNYTLILDNKLDGITIDTNGKLQDMNKKVDILTKQKTTNVIQREVRYVEKETPDDADVEMITDPARVSIRVNNGEKYYLDTIPTEDYKFEEGKLVIRSAYSTDLNITAPEYEKSKWSLTTALNSDKEVIGGVNYELGHVVSASVLVGQGIKPYYGLTFKIGGHE